MAPRLVGVDSAAPRLPQTVVTPTQGTAAVDVAPGDVGAAYLPRAGGTVTGPLTVTADLVADTLRSLGQINGTQLFATTGPSTIRDVTLTGTTQIDALNADPINPMEPATKAYVDAQFAGGGVGFVSKTGDTMLGTLRFGSINLGVAFDASPGQQRALVAFTTDRLRAQVADPYAFTVDVGAVERLRIDAAVRVNGALRATVPADYWSTTGTAVFVDAVGFLASLGSNRVSLVANGYRNTSGGWTSLGVAGNVGAAAVEVDPLGAVQFRTNATTPTGLAPTERARVNDAGILVGKASSSVSTLGLELYGSAGGTNGIRVVSNDTAIAALDVRALTGATPLAVNVAYNGTQIGSVARNGTNNGTLFNTTSHGPWKAEGDPITDDEAMATIRAYRPVRYQWRLNANGQMTADGTPAGPFQRGLIAQDVVDVMAEAVNVGGDDERREGFTPWGVDYGRITPDLIAAVQAIDRRLAALEAA
jgi:hypothetical protein